MGARRAALCAAVGTGARALVWVAAKLGGASAVFVLVPRLRQAVACFSLMVSVGLAELAGTDTKPEDLLARADAALYEAKRAGRNRVNLSPAIDRSAA